MLTVWPSGRRAPNADLRARHAVAHRAPAPTGAGRGIHGRGCGTSRRRSVCGTSSGHRPPGPPILRCCVRRFPVPPGRRGRRSSGKAGSCLSAASTSCGLRPRRAATGPSDRLRLLSLASLAGDVVVVAVKPRPVPGLPGIYRCRTSVSCRLAVGVVHRRFHLRRWRGGRRNTVRDVDGDGGGTETGGVPVGSVSAPGVLGVAAISSCSACVTHRP